MKTFFEVEWEAKYIIGSSRKHCFICTKEYLHRPSQLKKNGEPKKGAKKHAIHLVQEMVSELAMHIVLAHNALIREYSLPGEGVKQIIKEHIDKKTAMLKEDMNFYLGMPLIPNQQQ